MPIPSSGASVYGIDLGKNLFHVVGCDSRGRPVQRAKFTRDRLLAFFANATAALIGMEACPGSQWLARKLSAMGHDVRIIAAQFVKPYLKSDLAPISPDTTYVQCGVGSVG